MADSVMRCMQEGTKTAGEARGGQLSETQRENSASSPLPSGSLVCHGGLAPHDPHASHPRPHPDKTP